MKILLNNETKNSLIEFVVYDVIKKLGLNNIKQDIRIEIEDIEEYINPFVFVLGYTTPEEFEGSEETISIESLVKNLENTKRYLVKIFDNKNVRDSLHTVAHELRHVWQTSTEEGRAKTHSGRGKFCPLIHRLESDAERFADEYVSSVI